MEDEEIINQQPAAEPTPTYKDKMMGRIKSVKPDYEPADDEDMLKQLDELYSENETKLGEFEGIAKSVTDLTAKDPKFAAIIEIMRNPKNPKTFGYAFAKVYGRDFLDADDDEIEAGEREYQQSIGKMREAQAAAQNNFKQTLAYLDEVAQENGLDESQKNAIYEKMIGKAENYLNGSIPKDEIDDIRKAMFYDQDVKDAADAGVAQGKSMRVEEKLVKPTTMPDMGSGTGAGSVERKFERKMTPLERFRSGK